MKKIRLLLQLIPYHTLSQPNFPSFELLLGKIFLTLAEAAHSLRPRKGEQETIIYVYENVSSPCVSCLRSFSIIKIQKI